MRKLKKLPQINIIYIESAACLVTQITSFAVPRLACLYLNTRLRQTYLVSVLLSWVASEDNCTCRALTGEENKRTSEANM